MYYQSYEDYMRQVLGYPIDDASLYETYNYRNEGTYATNQIQFNMKESEINKLYPESYNLIYPLVCKACDTNVEPISVTTINKMTDDIYNLVEKNQNIINVKIGIKNRELEHNDNKKTENSQTIKLSARQELKQNTFHTNSKQEIIKENTAKRTPINFENKVNSQNRIPTKIENREVLNDTRQQNNNLLRDLIKILILQKLFGDETNRPPRPTPPPHYSPARPPFPGGRPPMGAGMNRMDFDYTEYL